MTGEWRSIEQAQCLICERGPVLRNGGFSTCCGGEGGAVAGGWGLGVRRTVGFSLRQVAECHIEYRAQRSLRPEVRCTCRSRPSSLLVSARRPLSLSDFSCRFVRLEPVRRQGVSRCRIQRKEGRPRRINVVLAEDSLTELPVLTWPPVPAKLVAHYVTFTTPVDSLQ